MDISFFGEGHHSIHYRKPRPLGAGALEPVSTCSSVPEVFDPVVFRLVHELQEAL